jgi:hypothetical protein
MNVKTETQEKQDYLILTATGTIQNSDDWIELAKKCYTEMERMHKNKLIMNGIELEKPKDLFTMCDLTESLLKDFPPNVRSMKIAAVSDIKYKELLLFWETFSYNRGFCFKAFFSLEEACAWMGKNTTGEDVI